jgi:hypothetical protein
MPAPAAAPAATPTITMTPSSFRLVVSSERSVPMMSASTVDGGPGASLRRAWSVRSMRRYRTISAWHRRQWAA